MPCNRKISKMKTYEEKIKEADALYIERLKKLSGEERIKIASDLFEAVKEIARAGIIHQNPNISDEGLKAELNNRLGR